MAIYENGVDTKKNILKVCKKLFYEKGYDKTTFDNISAAANIYRTSIAYHFKSKKSIGNIIFEESVTRNTEIAHSYTKNKKYDYFVGTAIFWYKFLKDEKYRNFFNSGLFKTDLNYDNSFIFKVVSDCFNLFDTSYEDFIENHELDIITVNGLEQYLTDFLGKNPDKFNFIQVTKHEIRSITKQLDISDKSFETAWNIIYKLIKLIPFEELDTTL